MEIEGKRILLSGATGGLGRAIAERLADEGAALVLSSRKGNELKQLARSLPGGARRHKTVVSDLAKAGAAEKLVRDAGRLDGLVANAALPGSGKLESLTQQQLTRATRVNFEAPIKMTRELLPALLERGEGHIVFISSLNGRYATARASVYSATKFGLRGFAFGLREDLYASGVGISVVSPGTVAEAGMYADSGATKGPPGLGVTTPAKVGKAVARAIRTNKAEIPVAPRRQTFMATFAGRHPELAGRITRNRRAEALVERVTDGQVDKR